MPTVLAWFGRSVVRAKVAVVAAYAVLVPISAAYGAGVLKELQPGGFRDPAAESSRAADLSRSFVAGDLVVLYTAKPSPGPGTADDVVAWDSVVPALARVEAESGGGAGGELLLHGRAVVVVARPHPHRRARHAQGPGHREGQGGRD